VRAFRLPLGFAALTVTLLGAALVPDMATAQGPDGEPPGYWQLVDTFKDEPAKDPNARSEQVTVTEGSIKVRREYLSPDEGPSTHDVECTWTWRTPHGMDRLVPGEPVDVNLTIVDASVPEQVSGWNHGYTGGSGGIRVTVGEARYPCYAAPGSALELVNLTVGWKGTSSLEGSKPVPYPRQGTATMAIRATCGAAFERVYEWRAGQGPSPPGGGAGTPPAGAPPPRRKPLCAEGLARYPELAASPHAMTMDLADLKSAFNDGIRRYVEKAGRRAFVEDNVMGTLPALNWLSMQGGIVPPASRRFVFASDADRAAWAGGGVPQSTAASPRGTELYLYNSLYEAAVGPPPRRLTIGDVVYLALDQRNGNMKEAMLLAHNTFRALAREGGWLTSDHELTGVGRSPEFITAYVEPLVDPPPLGPDQNTGALYHLFGMAYFELQARGAYSEAIAVEWAGEGVALGAELVKMRSILASDPQLGKPGTLSAYATLANEAEQVYRKYWDGSPDDPWKYCYNLFAARIGTWLYNERMLRTGVPVAPLPPGMSDTVLGPLPDATVSISASPLDVTFSGGGRTMTLEQASESLRGEYPVSITPFFEEDTGSWGAVWRELTPEPYELRLTATAAGWAHLTRLPAGTDEVLVYAMPLEPGETFVLPVRPGVNATPMTSSRGTTITPVMARTGGSPATRHPAANVARGRPTTQSTTGYASGPERAVDGSTDGDVTHGSVTHTQLERQPWWQVDLGSAQDVERVTIWNRTDCCSDRLSDLVVLVSETPIPGPDLRSALSDARVWSRRVPGRAQRTTEVPVGHRGRYVRIQLEGESYLSLAEVEIFTTPPP